MVIGAVLGFVAKAVAKPVLGAVLKTGAKEGAKAGVKAGGKEFGQMMTKEGFKKIGKEGAEKAFGKAGGKIFDNIGKTGFDSLTGAVKKTLAGKAGKAEGDIFKSVFSGIPIGREIFKQLGDFLLPAGGKKAGALLADQASKLFGTSAFSKIDTGM